MHSYIHMKKYEKNLKKKKKSQEVSCLLSMGVCYGPTPLYHSPALEK